ncbi:MAG: AMP-binding protein [Burkholderiales bacterium]|nr:AMP-binding protein [Burkholderiales bacterium]
MERQPFTSEIWDERETWSRDRLHDYQLRALRRQIGRLATDSAFHAARFAAAGFVPADLQSLEDLRRLPLTTKQDYLDALGNPPPWGSALGCLPRELARVHFSSGTTALPAPNAWTGRDLDRWADLYARYLYAQGLRSGDVFQVLFSYPWFVGGLGATAGAQRVGATVIPGGSGDTERQIQTMLRFGTVSFVSTPSFAAYLAEVARGLGIDPREIGIRALGLGGEPGASIESTRRALEQMWGAQVYDCYGCLEFQPIAWATAAQPSPVLCEDFLFAEVLDPSTKNPVADGEPGVLVLTHLDKIAYPLVRWWTGDIVVRDTRISDDGRTHGRLVGGVRGRADDMLIVRGVNLFPSAVEEVVRSTPGASGEYLVIVDADVRDAGGFLAGIKLRVEATPDAPADLGSQLSDRVRTELLVRATVEVVPAGSMARATHKAKRLLRT